MVEWGIEQRRFIERILARRDGQLKAKDWQRCMRSSQTISLLIGTMCPYRFAILGAVLIDKADWGAYQCPCYKTTFRGPEWIFNCQLKSKADIQRWILAGVGLLCDITN